MGTLSDHSLMPFGKHKGRKMANVPSDYLLYLYNKDLEDGDVKTYIEENIDVLKKEVKEGINVQNYKSINND